MNKLQVIFGMGLALAVLLAACAPAAAPEPPTPTLVTVTTDTAVPTLVPLTLGGPSAGTILSWMDGSSLVYVPAGQFTMGADGADNPSHVVSLSAYWITRTKITNRMYALCVGVGVCTPPAPIPGGAVYTNPVYADHPVVGVTWEQANTYCGWAGGRLPTEAEWEKAARGPGGNTYPWGNEKPSCDLLNYNNCVRSTTSVVAYPESASPYLALDMAGNAFEWTRDWYDAAYYAASPIQDPPGPESGVYRVIRGSGFESDPSQIASAIRRPASPDYASRDLGFRCVVQRPINFPPYCQSSPYLPVADIPTPVTSACRAPVSQFVGRSCQGKIPSHTILLPRGTIYRIRSGEGFSCTDAIVNNMLQVTCTGPDAKSATLEVCNSTCEVPPTPSWNVSAVCDPGYVYDPATRQCLYTPLDGQPGPQGCPPAYALDPTGQTCRPTIGLDNQCPSGQYYDALYGGCVPANGQMNCNLYGLNQPSLAPSCYPGCPAGFSFNAASQCCQAPAVGLYPGCPPGLAYDVSLGACAPALPTVSENAGCAFVSVDMLQCAPPYNCGKNVTETQCIRDAANGCVWNEKAESCELQK